MVSAKEATHVICARHADQESMGTDIFTVHSTDSREYSSTSFESLISIAGWRALCFLVERGVMHQMQTQTNTLCGRGSLLRAFTSKSTSRPSRSPLAVKAFKERDPREENVPGSFFVDHTCMYV